MDGAVHAWSKWEVQILVLVSLALQVFLLMFARMCRRSTSLLPKILLWLVYLLADSTAIYILGHMAISSKSPEHQQLVAFWAPFLLVHLGGQDTITAYAMEDNQLWLRHLLILGLQALGAAYVLYKYIFNNWPLATAAVLMFVVGVLKYGERVWALKSASLENISVFLDSIRPSSGNASAWHYLYRDRGVQIELEQHRFGCEEVSLEHKDMGLGSEVIMKGAHRLLPICMGQFVDYKFWPSLYETAQLRSFGYQGCMYSLIESQLSLMHDFLYTKAPLIHTWCGYCIRAFSLVATVTAFFLFKLSTHKQDYDRVDAFVTYTLLIAAFLLEIVSVLKAMGSTWACGLLRVRCGNRRWPSSIGQYNLIDFCSTSKSQGRKIARLIGCEDFWIKLHYLSSYTMISTDTKTLVLKEVVRVVGACERRDEVIKTYRGQAALNQCEGFLRHFTWSTELDFDDSIITWHIATDIFMSSSEQARQDRARPIVQAIKALSNYMMLLLVDRPYMLPSPVRPRLCECQENI